MDKKKKQLTTEEMKEILRKAVTSPQPKVNTEPQPKIKRRIKNPFDMRGRYFA